MQRRQTECALCKHHSFNAISTRESLHFFFACVLVSFHNVASPSLYRPAICCNNVDRVYMCFLCLYVCVCARASTSELRKSNPSAPPAGGSLAESRIVAATLRHRPDAHGHVPLRRVIISRQRGAGKRSAGAAVNWCASETCV